MQQSKKGRIVVLIPCYNNLDGLKKTVSTVKHKAPIDILIVDDGSNVGEKPTGELLASVKQKNVSIEIISLNTNKGIANALNEGLRFILKINQHQYIARVDCGDTCKPNRFAIQEDFLDNNSEVGLVGSWVKWKKHDSNQDVFQFRPPKKHKNIKRSMSLRCSIIHPTVMYRLSVVKNLGLYSTKYQAAEDYAYFFDIANNYETANIPRFLTHVEYNEKGISVQKRREQNKSKIQIIRDYGRTNVFSYVGQLYTLLLMNVPFGFVMKMKKALL